MAHALFTDFSSDDELKALVQFAHAAQPGADGFAATKSALIAGQTFEVLRELVGKIGVFYETEGALNSLLRLCTLHATQGALLVELAAEGLAAAGVGHEDIRLRSLVLLFNQLPAKAPQRYAVFSAVVQVSRSLGNVATLAAQLDALDGWLVDWGVAAPQVHTLLLLLADTFKDNGKPKESTALLVKHLASCASTPAALAAARPVALRLLAQVIGDAANFAFDGVLALDAVQHLQGEPLHALALIFSSASLPQFEAWVEEHGSTCDAFGLHVETLLHKARLLALLKLCSSAAVLDFATIASALKVGIADAEIWVIEGIQAGLIEAKVDQLHATVTVLLASRSAAQPVPWDQLLLRLQAWQANLAEVQRVLANVTDQVVLRTEGLAQPKPQRLGRL